MSSGGLQKSDRTLLMMTVAFIAFGLVFVYSSSYAVASERFHGASFFLVRQGARAVIGLLGIIILANIDYHKIGRLSVVLFLLSILLLVYVLVAGEVINGARRWINVGPIRMQVSEMARLAMVLMITHQLARKNEQQMRQLKEILIIIVEVMVVIVLVAIEPNFSSSAVIGMLALSIFFVAGLQWRWIIFLVVFGAVSGAAFVASAEYRRERIIALVKGDEHAQNLSFQQRQAINGIGNGRLVGVGIGCSVQKQHFLPEAHTDFVFSVLGEEIGFFGLLGLLGAYGFYIVRCLTIARYAPDRLGQLMAFGLTMLLTLNVVVHSAVNTSLAPTTGIPLPFISYGGMSLIFSAVGVGVLLNISSQTTIPQGEKL